MDSSKEHIEAQLCAYIEGDLSDAQRAEIERHLDANPRHRALIADLQRQRMDLASLPRAKAPAELNEALCGQLERSALLDPSETEEGEIVLRINRWPQFAAVAAVALLAIGLGIVVYSVLPGAGGQRSVATGDGAMKHPDPDRDAFYRDYKQYAESAKKSAVESETARKSTLADDSRKAQDELAKEMQDRRTNRLSDPAGSPDAEKKPRPNELAAGKGISDSDATGKDVIALRNQLDLRSRGVSSTYVMYVSAEDVNAASDQVAALLKSNGITYRQETLQAFAPSAVAMNLVRPNLDGRGLADKAESSENGASATFGGGRGAASGPAGGMGGARPTAPARSDGDGANRPETENMQRNANAVEIQPGGGSSGEVLAAKPKAALDRSLKAPAIAPDNTTRTGGPSNDQKQSEKMNPEKRDEQFDYRRSADSRYKEELAKSDRKPTLDQPAEEKRTAEGFSAAGSTLGETVSPVQGQAQMRTSGVIVATMNRRQAQEMAQTLSHGGQRADLQEAAPNALISRVGSTKREERAIPADSLTGPEAPKTIQPAPGSAGDTNNSFFAATTPATAKDTATPTTQPTRPPMTLGVPTTHPAKSLFERLPANADQPVPQKGVSSVLTQGGLHLDVDLADQPIEVMIVVQQPVAADNVSQPANPAPTTDAGAKKEADK